MKKKGKQTFILTNKPQIIGRYSIAGEKEGNGNFGKFYDYVLKNDKFGEKTFEHTERKMLEQAVFQAIEKSGLKTSDIEILLMGDLLDQIISSAFTARQFDSIFLGLYGACSTIAESLGLGALLIDSKYVNKVVCATASHFSTVERQYRFPLELGNQRPPTSQWTVTGAGAFVLSSTGGKCEITEVTFGKVMDFGVKDVNNMGAAMAPAAMDTIITHFKDTGTKPENYDLILTGDLGKLGSEIFLDLMEHNGYRLGTNYCDCGQMMYSDNQKTFQGASGPGCSAIVLASYVLSKMESNEYKKVLFAPTGALLSPLSSQQGDSIPCICHAITIERVKENWCMWLMYLKVFAVGGLICMLGQLLIIKTTLTSSRILVLFVCIGAVLEGFDLYDPIVSFAGAGATVPITGFGRSLAKGVIDAVKEKGVLGLFTGGLTATSGGIAAAVIFAYIFSAIFSSKTKKY